MGLLSKLWQMGGIAPEGDDMVAAVAEVAQTPERWARLHPEKLKYLLYYEVLRNSSDPDPERFARLFEITNTRLPPGERMKLVKMFSETCENGSTPWLAFVPFLHFDADWQIVATAALDCALLAENDEGESLCGPRRLIDLARELDDDERRATVLGGLLSTGDRRVSELVFAELSSLGVAGGERLAGVQMMSAFAAVLDFYADWIELLVDGKVADHGGGVLGAVAGRLAAAVNHAMPPNVVEVKRAFPAMSAPGIEGVAVVRSWSFPEYRQILEQRLARVMDREKEPKVVALALENWRES